MLELYLDCIAADTKYSNKIYIFMYDAGNKIVICQLQNEKSNFPKISKFIHGKKQNTNLVYLYIHLVETFALVLNSKIILKKLFLLKLSILKDTLLALNKLIIR